MQPNDLVFIEVWAYGFLACIGGIYLTSRRIQAGFDDHEFLLMELCLGFLVFPFVNMLVGTITLLYLAKTRNRLH
jgi:hypothetical protein